MGNVLAIDIGGHRVKTGLLAGKDNLRLYEEAIIEVYPSVLNDPSLDKSQVDTKEKIETVVKHINQNYQQHLKNITHIGVSSTDIVDTNQGLVLRSTSPTYAGTNWPSIIRERIDILPTTKLYVQNDAKCGAWAEYLFLKDQSFKMGRRNEGTLVRITVGSGVGSGIIINGKIFEGSGYVAGEVAYIPYNPQTGYDCEYGKGCVEKHASVSGLLKTARQLMKSSKTQWAAKNMNNHKLSLDDIQDGLDIGDPCATGAVEDAGKALGYALMVIINFLGPNIVTVGGGVLDKLPKYFDVAASFAKLNSLPPAIEACTIMKSEIKDHKSILLGIADLTIKHGKNLSLY